MLGYDQTWIQTVGFTLLAVGAGAVIWAAREHRQMDKRSKKKTLTFKKKSIKTPEQLKEAKWVKVGKVTDIWIYPVKSCAAISVDSAYTARLGLQSGVIKDRIFMIVNEKGIMITGRIVPSAVLIKPQWSGNLLTLTFTDTEPINIDIKKVEDTDNRRTVKVWSDQVPGLDCGDEVAEWLSKVLKRSCRLVYHSSLSSPRTTCDEEFPLLQPTDNSYYSDLSGYMLMTKESIEDLASRVDCDVTPPNFRPNILMEGSKPYMEDEWEYVRIGEVLYRNAKPCDRCIFTTINHKNGTKNKQMEPLRTLRSYRCTAGATAPFFGINLGLDDPGTVHVGDDIYATMADN